jgi:hypothetical protein
MMRRPDRLDRLVLTVLGLLLAAAGGYGLARSHGALGSHQEHDPVLIPGLRSFVADHHDWFWWGAGAACLVLALISLAWLRAQLRFSRPGNDGLTRVDDHGAIRLRGGAAADALAAEVEQLPGVAAAAARIWGEADRPEIYLRVQLHDDAPVDQVRARVEHESMGRLRRALQVEAVVAQLDLRVAPPAGRSVL